MRAKKILSLAVSTILALSMSVPAYANSVDGDGTQQLATPTASKVLVNAKEVAFDAYNINNNNYFKLRDIAYALNDTENPFNVLWDATNKSIALESNKEYIVVGGELAQGDGTTKTATVNKAPIYLDATKELNLTAYNINGNTFFKLRDLADTFGFQVNWDATANIITVAPPVVEKPVAPPVVTPPKPVTPPSGGGLDMSQNPGQMGGVGMTGEEAQQSRDEAGRTDTGDPIILE